VLPVSSSGCSTLLLPFLLARAVVQVLSAALLLVVAVLDVVMRVLLRACTPAFTRQGTVATHAESAVSAIASSALRILMKM
jgi:hypothetical protein